MKPVNPFCSALAIVFSIALLAGCSKPDGDKAAAAPEKSEADAKAGVTVDAATQARIGLKMDAPVAMQWQPEVKGFGAVIDPATLTSAVSELESARSAADLSTKEFLRQKTLAAQDNASARTLETAQAAATHDKFAFDSALAKFKLDWGSTLAESGEREKIISAVINGTTALVRIALPPGEILSSPPMSARIVALTDETKSVAGDFFGATSGVDPQTQSQSFFFLIKGQALTSGAAVTGYLKAAGDLLSGVVVPASAILRHEGKGWVYVQSDTNQFVRVEIPLDRRTDGGWFVSENLSATNRIVVTGAQTVLSAELSGGGFNTGERD
jgi:hypothetical protein